VKLVDVDAGAVVIELEATFELAPHFYFE